MTATLDPTADQEVTYITGVTAAGTLAAQSFWTWNSDTPATYGSTDYEAKYGAAVAGAGGDITYSFDSASHWTAVEENAFRAGMALWSEVANVQFTEQSSGGDFTISRASDGTAEADTSEYTGVVGGTKLGVPAGATLSIDTSVGGFGPLGDAFNGYGGYPWMTLEHELGHIIGLGHAGPYNEGVTQNDQAYGPDDSRAYSLMSYIDPAGSTNWTITSISGAREEGSPVTPQMLDIAAAQRLYGLPVDTPLSGGQTFGFHSNIQGPTEPFFDFSVNTQPIVTLWDEGTGNTLDVSGFAQGSTLNLNPATFSSVAGMTNNVAIAYGTQIDEAVGGVGADRITGNTDADTLFGGAGDDTLVGGSTSGVLFGGKGDDQITGVGYLSGDLGDDTITGAGVHDTLLGGDGNDVIQASGQSWAFGNMGDDRMTATGAATLFGGQGDDLLQGTNVNGSFFFGNLGNDSIEASGSATIFGGQGDDHIQGDGSTPQYLSGDLGDDTIIGSGGGDTIVGGGGADILTGDGAGSHAADRFLYVALSDSTPGAPDRITDFAPAQDVIDISAIDQARAAAGQAAFHWVGAFDGGAGEAMVAYDASTNTTTLMLDADGDRAPDFVLLMTGNVPAGTWLDF